MKPRPGDRVGAGGEDAGTLVVADWRADPRAVVAACAHHAGDRSFALLVPSTLHGIDWVGDPYANVRCARRALIELSSLLKAAGLPIRSAELGDHDSVGAVMDAVLGQPVDRILVCEPSRRWRPRLIDLAHRARRATGLPVTHVAVELTGPVRRRVPWLRLWRGECPTPQSAVNFTPAIPV